MSFNSSLAVSIKVLFLGWILSAILIREFLTLFLTLVTSGLPLRKRLSSRAWPIYPLSVHSFPLMFYRNLSLFQWLTVIYISNGTFLMKMLRGKPCFLLQFHETVIGHLAWKQVFQMFTDIFLVIMLETAETSRMKQDKNDHNLSSLIRLGLLRYPLFLSSIIYFSCYNANSSQKSSAIQ